MIKFSFYKFEKKTTMRIDIITALPSILKGVFDTSILQRGIEKGIVNIHLHDLRNFSEHKQKKLTTIVMVVMQEWY